MSEIDKIDSHAHFMIVLLHFEFSVEVESLLSNFRIKT